MNNNLETLDRFGQALVNAAPAPPPNLAASVLALIQAEEQKAAHTPPVPLVRRRIDRWWRSILIVLAVGLPLSAGVGVARASDGALPGEPLYGVRTTREAIMLTLTLNPDSRDALALSLAQERVADLRRALGQHADPAVTKTILLTLVSYNSRVSHAHLLWLRSALTSQYQAVQRDRRWFEHVQAHGRKDVAAQVTLQTLSAGLSQIRRQARQAGAPWAQAGSDVPPSGPTPDGNS